MRFIERRTFGEIGSGLALSEDSARKRVERALAKLHRALAGRGDLCSTGAFGKACACRDRSARGAGGERHRARIGCGGHHRRRHIDHRSYQHDKTTNRRRCCHRFDRWIYVRLAPYHFGCNTSRTFGRRGGIAARPSLNLSPRGKGNANTWVSPDYQGHAVELIND